MKNFRQNLNTKLSDNFMPFNREAFSALMEKVNSERSPVNNKQLAGLMGISRAALYRRLEKIDAGKPYEPDARELDGFYRAAKQLGLNSLRFYEEPTYETEQTTGLKNDGAWNGANSVFISAFPTKERH